MGYDLDGRKLILSVNVIKYTGIDRDRNGTVVDEKNLLKTAKVITRKIRLRSHYHRVRLTV